MYKDFKAVDLGPEESALSHLGIQAGALPKLAMNDGDEKPPEHIRIVQLDECVLENPAAGLSRSLTSQDGGGSARMDRGANYASKVRRTDWNGGALGQSGTDEISGPANQFASGAAQCKCTHETRARTSG